MKERQIRELIEKFFDGDTTLAEEKKLYAFFSRGNVPESLARYRRMFADLAMLPEPAPAKTERGRLIRIWAAGIAASLLLFLGGYAAMRQYEYRQLDMRYGGSYMIVNGNRIDNLRDIKPYIEQTLQEGEEIKREAAAQPSADEIEAELLTHIGDPEERARIEELLDQ